MSTNCAEITLDEIRMWFAEFPVASGNTNQLYVGKLFAEIKRLRAEVEKMGGIRNRMQDAIDVMDISTSAAAYIWKEIEATLDAPAQDGSKQQSECMACHADEDDIEFVDAVALTQPELDVLVERVRGEVVGNGVEVFVACEKESGNVKIWSLGQMVVYHQSGQSLAETSVWNDETLSLRPAILTIKEAK